ncbi:MAG: MATE family efflux transporter [Syntrophus sp. (in: bacteria)]|nr:MATE family efflux transporter [Syntrophus sp. (in: bacteria)]
MILIMFFEFLIGLTDIYIAGRIGRDIQASYGFVIQMYFVFIIIANALTAGTVSVISRLFTAGDKHALNNAIYSVILTTIIAGIVFGIAGIVLTPVLVNFVNIPKELKPFAIPLGEIYAGGLLFHYIVINTNGILRACKQVRVSLKTMSIVCAANIGINFLLLFHTNIGYKGIALSTAISVCIGSMLNLAHMRSFIRGVKKFSLESMKAIINIGWPLGLGQGFWQLHSMMIYLILSALPRNSIETLAAFAAGLRIESAIFLPAMAFNMANAVIVGNLLGENKKEDAFRAGIITAIMGVTIVSCLTVIVILGAKWIAPLLSKNPVVITECVRYLYISMLSEPFMAFWLVLGGALSGAGDTKGVMFIVISCTWLIRIPLCYLLVVVLGFDAAAVWWMMNLSQFMTAVFMVRRYWQRKWLHGSIAHQ